MSSEQSHTTWDSMALKFELRRRGVYQSHIARDLETTQGFVSFVLAGERHGGKAREVMQYVADKLERPVEDLFPHFERRKENRAA